MASEEATISLSKNSEVAELLGLNGASDSIPDSAGGREHKTHQ